MTYRNDWKKLLIAEIKAGKQLNIATWTRDGSAWSTPFAYGEVVDLQVDGVSLIKETIYADCTALEGSFFHDFFAGILYVHLISGVSPGAFVSPEYTYNVVAFFWKCFANRQEIGAEAVVFIPTDCAYPAFYDPTLKADSLSQLTATVADYFESAMETSSGGISITNAEGWWYSAIDDFYWNNADIRARVGEVGDIYADLETIFTGKVQTPSVMDDAVTFELVDSREGRLQSIPTTYYDLTRFPDMDPDTVGVPIPILFGEKKNITPVRINSRTFKVSETHFGDTTFGMQAIDMIYHNGVALTTVARLAYPNNATIPINANQVWFKPTSAGGAGTGTLADPYDASTQVKFDTLITTFENTRDAFNYPLPITINLLAGTYETLGIHMWAYVQIVGAGMYLTTIKYVGDGIERLSGLGEEIVSNLKTVINSLVRWYYLARYMRVADLTVDCGGFDGDTRQIAAISMWGLGDNVIERVRVINSTSPYPGIGSENFILWIISWPDQDSYNNTIRDCIVEDGWGSMATSFCIAHGGSGYDLGGIIERNISRNVNMGMATAWATKGLIIRNNYFDFTNRGINIDTGNNYGMLISGNIIKNTYYIGIRFGTNGVNDGCIIENNDITTWEAADWGMLIGPNVTNLTIRGNKIYGRFPFPGSWAIKLDGTGNANFVYENNDIETDMVVDTLPLWVGIQCTAELLDGEFTLLFDPGDGLVTCDARGIQDGFNMSTGLATGLYSEMVADHLFFILHILNDIPVASINLSSFRDLSFARTQAVAWYLDTDTPTIDFNRLLQKTSIYHFLPLNDGTFAAKYYQKVVPAGTLELRNYDHAGFKKTRPSSGVFRDIILKYDKDPTTGIWLTVQHTENTVQQNYKTKEPYTIETALRDATEAAQILAFYVSLLKAPPTKIETSIPMIGAAVLPTDKLYNNRDIVADGKAVTISTDEVYVILQTRKDFNAGRVGLTAQLDTQLSTFAVYADIDYQDIAHVDHSDTIHADGGYGDHTDENYEDIAHNDHDDNMHNDILYGDAEHTDHQDGPYYDDWGPFNLPHVDETYNDHNDIAQVNYTDNNHEDVIHADHTDSTHSHEDYAYLDATHEDHQDGPYYDDYATVNIPHGDSTYNDHSDIDHQDLQHTDAPHVDTAYNDHTDTIHTDTHTDITHIDSEL